MFLVNARPQNHVFQPGAEVSGQPKTARTLLQTEAGV